jgi:hypothetical protein
MPKPQLWKYNWERFGNKTDFWQKILSSLFKIACSTLKVYDEALPG